MTRYFFAVCLCLCSACHRTAPPNATQETCTIVPAVRQLTQNQLVRAMRDDVVEGLAGANLPNGDGAMGRNKAAYFHVRFQTGIIHVADLAVDRQRTDILEKAVIAIEYAFRYQRPAGDFEMVVPAALGQSGTPNEADLASGVAFFAASLGPALLAFEESSWFSEQTAHRERIRRLMPAVRSLLVFLLSRQDILKAADARAPNRLLYDALALYSLGRYTDHSEAMQAGISFAQLALTQLHPQGYLVEGGGWDSSYQGVALSVGFRLLSLLPTQDPFRPALYDAMSCGTHWQMTRIKSTGEISTEANTRVYPGGEAFLGQEKQMAWTNTLLALLMFGAYTDQAHAQYLAGLVIAYY